MNTKRFDENSTILEASKDPIIGKYLRYIYFDFLDNMKSETIHKRSYYAVDGFNFFYEQAKLGKVKQYFVNKEKPDVSYIHISHKNNSRVAYIVSGGGLEYICNNHEGLPIAKVMFEAGYDVMLVIYSIKKGAYKMGPINDLANIIKHSFENKDELKINLDKYIVIGGSAGAYLVGQFGTKNHGYKTFALQKPSIFCLLYPVISLRPGANQTTMHYALNDEFTEENFKEWSINENMDRDFPQTYFVHAKDDPAVKVENSYLLKEQLKKFNIPHKYVEFKTGGHGWSIGKYMEEENWMNGFLNYLKENNI